MSAISKSKQRLARRLRSRRGREREGLALAEGPRVVLEALRSAVEVRWVLVGEVFGAGEPGRTIVARCRERGVEPGFAPDAGVRELCSTEAPQAVVACVRPPPLDARSLERGRHLMALGVQMPGNLGTLIRSAWAFGLDGVVVAARMVDPWNPKVVRGSAGGVFHLPLIAEPGWLGGLESTGAGDEAGGNVAGADRTAGLNVLWADRAGEPVEMVPEARAPDWVLVVGNEAGGVPPALRPLGRAVSVPMIPGVDSLNVAVAGSILMHELMRLGAVSGEGGGR